MSVPSVSTRLDRLTSERVATSGWPDLFAVQTDARFYQHPDWLLAADTHLLDATLEIACVYHDDRLVLLLPWQARVQRHRFAAPCHDHLTLGDILVSPALGMAARRSALDAALAMTGHGRWDWQMHNVPHHSALLSAIEGDPQWRRRESRQSAWFDLLQQPVPGGSKLRRNLKRLRVKLEQEGHLHAQWLYQPAELPEAFAHFLTLEASGWKGEQGQATAIAADLPLRHFYEQLLTPRFGGLQPMIALLWLDDRCIAAQYTLLTGHCLSLVKIAYDETFSRFSPGSLLLQDTAEHALTRDLKTLSLVTAPRWAERWHPRTEPVWHLACYASNTGGLTLQMLNRLKQSARARFRPAP